MTFHAVVVPRSGDLPDWIVGPLMLDIDPPLEVVSGQTGDEGGV
jgi:hypothetical protein